MSQQPNDRKFVALIFDRSYMIYDIMVPMQVLSSEMFPIKDRAEFVYGGIPRLCYHVEEYGRNLHIPKERLHKLHIPDSDAHFIPAREMQQWFMEATKYPISKLVVFRDNNQTAETNALIQWALLNKIQTLCYDNRGECTQPVTGALYQSDTYNEDVFKRSYFGRKYK